MKDIQRRVLEFSEKYNIEINPELRYIDLVSEIGELGKEILKGNNYGEQELIKTENLESEIGDSIFSLLCIANSFDIDVQKCLENVLEKYEQRFEEKGNISSNNI